MIGFKKYVNKNQWDLILVIEDLSSSLQCCFAVNKLELK